MRFRRVRHTLLVATLVGSSLSGQLSAQTSQGTVTGRITDAATGLAIPAVQLSVVGTTVGAQSNDKGEYTLRSVRSGAVEIRALRVGYAEQRKSVTIAAGQSTTLNIQ